MLKDKLIFLFTHLNASKSQTEKVCVDTEGIMLPAGGNY